MFLLKRISFIVVLFSLISAGGALGQLNEQVQLGPFSQSIRLTLVYPGVSHGFFDTNINYSPINNQGNGIKSQSDRINFSTERITQYFSGLDSVKTTATIFGNKRAKRTVKLGLLAGGASYAGGLGLTYFALVAAGQECGLGCTIAMIVVPAGIGTAGIIGGSIYGFVSGKNLESTNEQHDLSLLPLNRLGLRLNVNFNTSPNNSLVESVLGLSFRHLPINDFLPNRYSLKFGGQGGYHLLINAGDGNDYENFIEQQVSLKRLGLEAVHINPAKIFSVIYGIEAGAVWGKTNEYHFEEGRQSEETSGKVWSPYTKIALGLNINVLNWASLEAMYTIEPFGLYQKEASRYNAEQQIVHSLGFGLSFYW